MKGIDKTQFRHIAQGSSLNIIITLQKYDIVFTVEYSTKILSRKLCLVKFDAPMKSNHAHCGAKER